MSELPKGWRDTELRNLVPSDAPILYGILQPGPDLDDGVPYVRPTEIDADQILLENLRRTSKDISDKYKRSVLKSNDIVMSMVGTIGKVAIVPPILEGGNITQSSVRIRPNSEVVDPRYLAWQLRSPLMRRQYDKKRLGTAVPRLNVRDIRSLNARLAPLPEQRRIVSRIEELFSRLDAGVAALREAKAQLQRYRQSVLTAAVTGQLTKTWREQHPDMEPASELLKRILKQRREQWSGKGKYKEPKPFPFQKHELSSVIPSNWENVSMEMLIEPPQYGTSKKCSYDIKGSSVLRIPNVINGVIDAIDLKFAKFNEGEIANYSIRENDLLMIRSNGSLSIVGRTALVRRQDQHHLYAGYLIRLRPIASSVNGHFLNLALAANPLRLQIERKAKSTSGVNNINAKEIQSLVLQLPPLAEQQQIVAEVEARTTAIVHLEAELDRQITRSNRLRQSVLSSAFQGKL